MSLVLPVRGVLGDSGNGESGTLDNSFRSVHTTVFAMIGRLRCDHAAS